MGEIQRIKHQKALEYWSQILKEQQESGLCIKSFCRSRLFEKLPDMDFKIHPELLQQVMPWSEEVQNICKEAIGPAGFGQQDLLLYMLDTG